MDDKEIVLKSNENNSEEPESLSSKKSKNLYKSFKDKECHVIKYNKCNKTLDVLFDRYGIRLFNVENFSGDTVIIKYKGEIGKPDFEYKL